MSPCTLMSYEFLQNQMLDTLSDTTDEFLQPPNELLEPPKVFPEPLEDPVEKPLANEMTK